MLKKTRSASGELDLNHFVAMLNGETDLDPQAKANLIQLVDAWHKAQSLPPNAFEQEGFTTPMPVVLKMVFPPGCPRWREIKKRGVGRWEPAGTGLYSVVNYSRGKAWTAWDLALDPFIRLLNHPKRDKLSGPCARCGRYYLKKRASQKVYCSRTCGNAATALARTRRKWDEERRERLKQAHKAFREWSRTKTAEPFQTWAEERYPSLTQRFLTRAIHQKELPEPPRR